LGHPPLPGGFQDQLQHHGERRPDRSVGIVSVGDRSAEHRHDGIADELLDRAAEPFDLGSGAFVVLREHAAHVFGIELLGLRSEPDQIHEQDRHDASLFTR